MKLWGLLAPATLAVALLVAPSARGQTDPDALARGIDPVSFKLSPSINSYLTSAGARLPKGGAYSLELLADYNKALMSLKLGDEKLGNLIEHRLDLHLMAAYGIVDGLEAGVDVPLTVLQVNGFDELEQRTGFADTAPGSVGLGDVRGLLRARLLSEDKFPIGLAVIGEVRAPTGDDQGFVGERGWHISPRAVAELPITKLMRGAVEVGYRLRTEPGRYLNLYVGDEITASIAGSHELPKIGSVTGTGYVELLASTPSRAPFTFDAADALKTALEALLGARADFGKHWQAELGVGRGLGVPSGFGREDLRVFAGVRWRGFFPPSREKDGDRDDDGVPDSADLCPDEPGPAKYDGCPDRDNDEIPDVFDRCPDEPGSANTDGCPQKPAVRVEQGEIFVMGSITFDSGTDTLKSESFPLLDEVVGLLKGHPEMKKVRVEGHTDSVGGFAMNLELSQRRSVAVKKYLVAHGIVEDRLVSEGFGPTKPIAPNTNALGRAKNRRVEFRVLESSEVPASGTPPTGAPSSATPSSAAPAP